MSVKISELSENCGITADSSCLALLQRLKNNPDSDENLIKLIRCLEKNKLIDNDLLTLQSSIILELSQIDGGYTYLDKYCDFLYNHIYKPWVISTRDYIDSYVQKFSALCDNRADELFSMKRASIYLDIPNAEFLEAIKSLSVVFLLLEFADEISSYGYEKQASIVDKLNQILVEIEIEGRPTFKKLAKKRDLRDIRGLPKIYQQTIEYKLGCNCLCNSMFILSFLRILAKNQRLGKFNDPRVYGNVNAFRAEGESAGHTFIVINLDPLAVSFDPAKKLYIECTAGWSELNLTNRPLHELEGNEFMVTVFRMIETFLRTSQQIVTKYKDRMYPLDSSKIYLNNIRNYIIENPDKLLIWERFWPSLFSEDIFDPLFQYEIGSLSHVQKIITILDYLKKFSKLPLYDDYKPFLVRLFLSRELAQEIHNEVKYHGQLLLEFLQSWNLNERPSDYNDLSNIIRTARSINGW